MTTDYAPSSLYLDYLRCRGVVIEATLAGQVEKLTAPVNWDDPQTATDYQGTAVLALIEAEQTEDLETRRLYFDMALEALEAAVATGEPSLALGQWAIAQSLLGNLNETAQLAFNELIAVSASVFEIVQDPCQLVYVPAPGPGSAGAIASELLPELLGASGLGAQRLLLAAEAMCRGNLVLYNPIGERSLQILAQLLPHSHSLNCKLGVYQLANQHLEGFLRLSQARALSSLAESSLRTLTAFQLAAQTYQSPPEAKVWQEQVRVQQVKVAPTLPVWAKVTSDADCVYVPYDKDICFAAEPTLSSIVTRVLLAEGDWFEREMELWRKLIQPGMTVIDVGANSGVYAFSAAKRVGKTGKVIAIEPFQGCVNCLKKTCEVNGFDWVTVCAAAASNRPGQSFLKLHAASELNEISAAGIETDQNVQAIDCITLDSLLNQENLERVDFLKIDAEGHEVQVLQGAEQLLNKFRPVILYENIAGQNGLNLLMAEVLEQRSYQLFTYQSWVQQLIPVESTEDLQGVLNVIAVARDNVPGFLAQTL